MPAKDRYYDVVLRALVKEGWTITDEEFHFSFGERSVYVDLLAQKPLTAQKGAQKIAVEVKTFAGKGKMADIEKALGQFMIYKTAIRISRMEHELFLAVPADLTYFFSTPDVVEMRRDASRCVESLG